PAATDGQEATAAIGTRALLDACGPGRPRTRGPRGTDPAQLDRTASELLVVKVVANLDLPGALSITDAPRGPRSACDQRRSRWNQLIGQGSWYQRLKRGVGGRWRRFRHGGFAAHRSAVRALLRLRSLSGKAITVGSDQPGGHRASRRSPRRSPGVPTESDCPDPASGRALLGRAP